MKPIQPPGGGGGGGGGGAALMLEGGAIHVEIYVEMRCVYTCSNLHRKQPTYQNIPQVLFSAVQRRKL